MQQQDHIWFTVPAKMRGTGESQMWYFFIRQIAHSMRIQSLAMAWVLSVFSLQNWPWCFKGGMINFALTSSSNFPMRKPLSAITSSPVSLYYHQWQCLAFGFLPALVLYQQYIMRDEFQLAAKSSQTGTLCFAAGN